MRVRTLVQAGLRGGRGRTSGSRALGNDELYRGSPWLSSLPQRSRTRSIARNVFHWRPKTITPPWARSPERGDLPGPSERACIQALFASLSVSVQRTRLNNRMPGAELLEQTNHGFTATMWPSSRDRVQPAATDGRRKCAVRARLRSPRSGATSSHPYRRTCGVPTSRSSARTRQRLTSPSEGSRDRKAFPERMCDIATIGDVSFFERRCTCRYGSAPRLRFRLLRSSLAVCRTPALLVMFRAVCRGSRRFPTDALVPNEWESRANTGRGSRKGVSG